MEPRPKTREDCADVHMKDGCSSRWKLARESFCFCFHFFCTSSFLLLVLLVSLPVSLSKLWSNLQKSAGGLPLSSTPSYYFPSQNPRCTIHFHCKLLVIFKYSKSRAHNCGSTYNGSLCQRPSSLGVCQVVPS